MAGPSREHHFPEGGWGWMAVLAVSIHTFFKGGITKAFSLVFEEMRERYDSSAQATAWAYALHEMSCYITAPVSAMVVARYSCRPVGLVSGLVFSASIVGVAYSPYLALTCILFGFFAGISLGTLSMVKFVNLREWWDRRLARVTSIGLMPSGIGAMLFSAFLPLSFNYYGYSGTILIVGGLALHCVLIGALSRSPDRLDFKSHKTLNVEMHDINQAETQEGVPHETSPMVTSESAALEGNEPISNDNKDVTVSVKTSDSKTADTTDTSLLKEQVGPDPEQPTCGEKVIKYFDYRLLQNVRCLSISLLMCGISLTLALTDTHFAGFAKEKGLSIRQISTLLTITGALSIPTRLFAGFFFDLELIKPRRIYVYAAWDLILGTLLLLLPNVSGMIVLYILWIIYAVLDALLSVMNTVVLSDVVDKPSYRSAMGVQRFFRGLGVIVGPPLGGYLKDVYGIYDYAMYLGGAVAIVSGIFFIVTVTLKNKRMK